MPYAIKEIGWFYYRHPASNARDLPSSKQCLAILRQGKLLLFLTQMPISYEEDNNAVSLPWAAHHLYGQRTSLMTCSGEGRLR